MSLKRQASSAVKWMAVSTVLVQLFDLLQRAILARLLDRADFGLASMALVVVAIGNALADFGLNNAIVHRQETTRDELSSLYWLNVAAGLGLFVLVLLMSRPIAAFYGESQLEVLIPLASVPFLFGPFGAQFQTLLQKDLRFGLVARVEMVAALLSIIVALTLAFNGWGVLAIIWRNITRSAVMTICMIFIGLRKWRPRLHFRWRDLDGYLSFGLFQMGQAFVARLSQYLDQILIGRVLGKDALGLYSLARMLILEPLVKITPVLTRVAFPVFAKRQHDLEKLRRGFMTVSRTIAFAAYPAFIGMAVVAPVLVPLIYGENWLAAIPLVQWFAPFAIMKALGSPLAAVVLARGRADISFVWFIGVTVLSLGAFYFAAPHGVIYVVYASIGVASVLLVLRTMIIKWLIGISYTEYFVKICSPLALSLAMGALVYGADWLARSLIPGLKPNWLYLFFLLAVGAISYGALAWKLEGAFLRGAWEFLRNRGAGSAPAGS